jgi:hypothetical protein
MLSVEPSTVSLNLVTLDVESRSGIVDDGAVSVGAEIIDVDDSVVAVHCLELRENFILFI